MSQLVRDTVSGCGTSEGVSVVGETDGVGTRSGVTHAARARTEKPDAEPSRKVRRFTIGPAQNGQSVRRQS